VLLPTNVVVGPLPGAGVVRVGADAGAGGLENRPSSKSISGGEPRAGAGGAGGGAGAGAATAGAGTYAGAADGAGAGGGGANMAAASFSPSDVRVFTAAAFSVGFSADSVNSSTTSQ